jgi:hypothetical protein
MHGFFMDARLFERVKAVADPRAYDDYVKTRVAARAAKKNKDRIAVKRKLPAVNQEFAQVLLAAPGAKRAMSKAADGSGNGDGNDDDDDDAVIDEDAAAAVAAARGADMREIVDNPLMDDRFSSMFAKRDFEIDVESAEYARLNPNAARSSRGVAAMKRRKLNDSSDSDDSDDDDDDDDVGRRQFDAVAEDDDEEGEDDSDDDMVYSVGGANALVIVLCSLHSALSARANLTINMQLHTHITAEIQGAQRRRGGAQENSAFVAPHARQGGGGGGGASHVRGKGGSERHTRAVEKVSVRIGGGEQNVAFEAARAAGGGRVVVDVVGVGGCGGLPPTVNEVRDGPGKCRIGRWWWLSRTRTWRRRPRRLAWRRLPGQRRRLARRLARR